MTVFIKRQRLKRDDGSSQEKQKQIGHATDTETLKAAVLLMQVARHGALFHLELSQTGWSRLTFPQRPQYCPIHDPHGHSGCWRSFDQFPSFAWCVFVIPMLVRKILDTNFWPWLHIIQSSWKSRTIFISHFPVWSVESKHKDSLLSNVHYTSCLAMLHCSSCWPPLGTVIATLYSLNKQFK